MMVLFPTVVVHWYNEQGWPRQGSLASDFTDLGTMQKRWSGVAMLSAFRALPFPSPSSRFSTRRYSLQDQPLT